MTPGNIAAGFGAAVITACLLSIAGFLLLGAVASVLTIVRARRRAKRFPPLLTDLARGASLRDLAEIDGELDRVLARER